MAEVKPLKLGSKGNFAQFADGDVVALDHLPTHRHSFVNVDIIEGVADGENTEFELAEEIDPRDLVLIEGLIQAPEDYTIDSTTLTFDVAPPNGALIEIRRLAGDVNASGMLSDLLNLLLTLEPGQTIGVNEEGSLIASSGSIGGKGMVIDDETDWGDGSDGAVTATSETITEDINATTYEVPEGVTVSIGWNSSESRPAIIRATTSIIVAGTITANGSDGGDYVSTAEGGVGGASLTGGGGGGGAGATTPGAGGSSGRPSSNGQTSPGAVTGGYQGGAGANCGSPYGFGAGGAGGRIPGTATITRAAGGSAPLVQILTPPNTMSELIGWADCGGGGGGGGSVSAGNTGGGGGGGGGVFLAAPELEISGTGVVTANGGNGGASRNTSYTSPGGGGGGGGVFLVSRDLTISGTVSANGGVGGAIGNVWGDQAEPGHPGTVYIAVEEFPTLSLSGTRVVFFKVASA